ncbi:MAG: hypothetical protein JW891_03500 [Candidatus Lokiarchaeota archaeon]|nr:hypothetical protein [Candidatus Lokiarchaeota archaeon]
MENQNEDEARDDKAQAEKLKNYIDDITHGKKAPVAKDLVQLKHVEVKKQEVGKETKNLAKSLKEKGISPDGSEKLTSEEISVLEAFEKKRLFLPRIAIVVNQSRVIMGNEGFKKAELEAILDQLILKGFVETQVVNDNTVYIITEKGQERIQ